MEQSKHKRMPLSDKLWIAYAVIVILILAIGAYPIYKAMRHGWLIIESDSGCYLVGQQGDAREGRIHYHIRDGVYTIKSDKHPDKSWTLITTGHSFKATMPSGTCASVLDPRLERTFSCKDCAEAYWVTDSPE